MKQNYLILLLLSTIIFSAYAHTPYGNWQSFYFSNGAGIRDTADVEKADTIYLAIKCRNNAQEAMVPDVNGIVVSLPLDKGFEVGDSLLWMLVEGASNGNIPRVRFKHLKTGLYLKCGTVDGKLQPYVAPYFDEIEDAQVDFYLKHQDGLHYYIVGTDNFQFFNANSGTVTVQNKTSSNQGWALHAKKGPLPKEKQVKPDLSISTVESNYHAGGSVTFNINVAKKDESLNGHTLLYKEDIFVDTISINSNGQAEYTYYNLAFGNNEFTLVYTGDNYYGAVNTSKILDVGYSPYAQKTKLNLTMPSNAELYQNVTLSINIETEDGDIVGDGDVMIYVNDILKNKASVSFMGKAEVIFPNLQIGTTNIKAIYIGDKIDYYDSDTMKVSVDITPSTSKIIPYPVYFDLSSQFEITRWARENMEVALTHKYTKAFTTDSLPGVIVTDTISDVHKVKNVANGTSYGKLSDAYTHADYLAVPLGQNRPTSVKIKTPWLNKGAYNIYQSHRKSGTARMPITNVTLNDKELYWPNAEMDDRFLRSEEIINYMRLSNAKGNSSTGMNYMGSVSVESSGIQTLQISVAPEIGNDIWFDMIQLIPIDQDSLSINLTLKESLAKTYYPLFSFLGFAYQEGYNQAEIPVNFADNANLALPYQVKDMTDWGELYSFNIDSLEINYLDYDGEELYANYVTVYKADDKWTRVAEGYVVDGKFGGELPQGNYFYETDFYVEIEPGAYNYRNLISEGFFSLPMTSVKSYDDSNIKIFAYNHTLHVKGVTSAANIVVSDITGRLFVNSTIQSDSFYTSLPQGVYIVTVVSSTGTAKSKVIIK